MNRMRTITTGLAVVAIIAGFASAADFTGVGDLSGGVEFSEALGVSANGKVVVGRSKSTNGTEAFAYMYLDNTMTDLGDLPGGSFGSEAYAASRDGSVIVGKGISYNTSDDV